MTINTIKRINSIAFYLCLTSLIAGVAISLLGVWGIVGAADGLLWKSIATCAILFVGSISASAAIGCFKTNDAA